MNSLTLSILCFNNPCSLSTPLKPLAFNAPNRDPPALGIFGDFFAGLLGGLFLPNLGLVLGDFRLVTGLDLGLDRGLFLTGMDRLAVPGDAVLEALGDAVFEPKGDVVFEVLGDTAFEPNGEAPLESVGEVLLKEVVLGSGGVLEPDRLPPNLDGPNLDGPPLPAPPNLLAMEPRPAAFGADFCQGLSAGFGAVSSDVVAVFFCHESTNLPLGTPTLPLPARETDLVGIPESLLKDIFNCLNKKLSCCWDLYCINWAVS